MQKSKFLKNPVKSRVCGILAVGDRLTFLKKNIEKVWFCDIINLETTVNTVVVPYLWGIETCFLIFLTLNRIIFFIVSCTLPMRNWNNPSSVRVSLFLGSCTLPMRNWNIFLVVIFIEFLFCVVPYLWGIET